MQMTTRPGSIRVHFESLSANPTVFQISDQDVEQAKLRHPGCASRVQTSRSADFREIEQWLPEAEVLVTAFNVIADSHFPLRTLAQAAPKLRWIHLTSAGIDRLLPLDWVPPGVFLTNSSGIHSRKSSEYALVSILALHMRLPQLLTQQRDHQWRQVFTPSVASRTIAIIGLGALGSAAAEQAKRLGLTVIGVRRTTEPHPHVDELYTFDKINEAIARADIVYVATPLTAETRNLIGRSAFDAMKPGAALVNVGRANVVDYDILVDKLHDGSISAGMLDVFDPEPLPPESRLWSAPNLIVTPHVGMDEDGVYIQKALDVLFENFAAESEGRELRNVIDLQHGY